MKLIRFGSIRSDDNNSECPQIKCPTFFALSVYTERTKNVGHFSMNSIRSCNTKDQLVFSSADF